MSTTIHSSSRGACHQRSGGDASAFARPELMNRFDLVSQGVELGDGCWMICWIWGWYFFKCIFSKHHKDGVWMNMKHPTKLFNFLKIVVKYSLVVRGRLHSILHDLNRNDHQPQWRNVMFKSLIFFGNPCLNQRVSGYDSSGFRLCSCCSCNFAPTCSGCEMQGIRVKQPIHWHTLHYIQYSPSQYIFCSTCRQYCWFQVF